MISTLSGRVTGVALNHVVIEVGGFGIQVQVTPVTAAECKIGNNHALFTSLLVREDSLTLYGFLDEDSRDFFDLLQTVSGIGPRVAQAALSSFAPFEMFKAIAEGNASALEQIPGNGKKVAQRLVLELREKMQKKLIGAVGVNSKEIWSESLNGALTGLGYSIKEAESAIERVKNELGQSANKMDLSELLKLALSQSGKRK